MTLSISVPGYSPEVQLIGIDGTSSVEQLDGRNWLKGKYGLSVFGILSSDTIEFEPLGSRHSCVVERNEDKW
jgi:hypothetical protein